MPTKSLLSIAKKDDNRQNYKEAFSAFDWTNSGRISYGNLQVMSEVLRKKWKKWVLKAAMRRCGHNPTDIEVSDIINKIHDDSGSLDLEV